MSWLRKLILTNRAFILGAMLQAVTLLLGVQIGETRTQRAWDAERQKMAVHQAIQEQHAIDINNYQADANKEISDDLRKKIQILSARQPADVGRGMCDPSSGGGEHLSALSRPSEGVNGIGSHPVPPTHRDEALVSCEQVVQDAAKTTLMLVEFQRWYSRQSALQN